MLYDFLQGTRDLPAGFAPAKILAVPTTAGTGSEVTHWATVWGDDAQKYSLQHPDLSPESAVIDPTLTASMPPLLTLSTALDAFAHALEAVWNRNHSSEADSLAALAIREITNFLPKVLAKPSDISLRERLQIAALDAGRAMSFTKSALSHSLSYPLTAELGIPHGLACALTLGDVAEYNIVADVDRMQVIADALSCPAMEIPAAIEAFKGSLGIPEILAAMLPKGATLTLNGPLITEDRVRNNIRFVDTEGARRLLQRSLWRLPGKGRLSLEHLHHEIRCNESSL